MGGHQPKKHIVLICTCVVKSSEIVYVQLQSVQITVTSCKGMVRVDNNDHIYQHLHSLVSSTATQCFSSMVDSKLTRTLFAASPNCSSVCDGFSFNSCPSETSLIGLQTIGVFGNVCCTGILPKCIALLDVISSLSPLFWVCWFCDSLRTFWITASFRSRSSRILRRVDRRDVAANWSRTA